MNFTSFFVARPVATVLLTLGVALAGLMSFFLLPVSPLPNVDFPTISVTATMAGASPETMSTSVATPLERHLGTIADVMEMTSRSSVGSTRVTLQFNINRDIDGAARDVQAAISAARADLPASLRANPTYRKVNPADQPIVILALTSETLSPGQIYDAASSVIEQKMSQVDGIGDVQLNGSSLPAVRVELNPRALFKYGVGFEDVRAALSAANANSPKGAIEHEGLRYQLYVNDSATEAAQYRDLVVAYRNNAPVRLSDLGEVVDGVENIRNLGMADGVPAVLVLLSKQPGANVIDTVDRVRALLPLMQASLPPSVHLAVVSDSTITIRASVRDVEITLVMSTVFVLIVVFLFLRSVRAAIVPSVAVPLSLLGTFGIMYLLGYSLDNFSLMALTISTGFVVDDAIVVLENVTRHIESGKTRLQAALLGAQEVSFTVVAMSVSLIAVFVPILLMGGLVGRLFHEFAVTLSAAILVSLIISLTTTPMMCAYLAVAPGEERENWLTRRSRLAFEGLHALYDRSLRWSLRNPATTLIILVLAICFNAALWYIVPKGFFPQQDSGSLSGGIRADQTISYQAMELKFREFVRILHEEPNIEHVVGFTGGGGGRGGGSTNSGNIFAQLKPLSERTLSTDQIIAKLRPQLTAVAGARLFLQARQDVRAGGRQSLSQYEYAIQADTLDDLRTWVPKITDALQDVPELEDVNSDQEDKGLEIDLKIDRAAAARYGISIAQINNTLYDAFGQRQVSTIYEDVNQYHVVMEVAPQFWQSPETLKDIYVSVSGGAVSGTQASGAVAGTTVLQNTASPTLAAVASDVQRNQQLNSLTNSARGAASTGAAVSTNQEAMVPLSNFVSYGPGASPLSISHQGPFVATTFSFNLAPGYTLGQAVEAINRAMTAVHAPVSIHGSFAGTARQFQQSIGNEPVLILAAIICVYIVLGILYESYIHPITILSTLPSAGAGAVLALMLFRTEFSLIALIGVILLVGIVKKNAIMMIDFAIQAEREGASSRDAIYAACMKRFRPIMMTTMAALCGALPLALTVGNGAELRQPLGISIVGGLAVSQILTLYTTPVIYLYLDGFRLRMRRAWHRWYAGLMGDETPGGA